MITLSVDTTSQSYALGQVCGVLAVAAVAITFLWKASASWRAPATPVGGDPAQTARLEIKRRWLVIGVTVLIALAAVVKGALGYHPEPRASEATPAGSNGTAPLHQPSSITPPQNIGGYRLLTGDSAARAETAMLAGRSKPDGLRIWFYDQDGDESVRAVFTARSTDWDPTLRSEKNSKPVSQEFRNFFAGAKAHDVTTFDPGPAGGSLSCGYATGPNGDQAICAWSSPTTFGALRLADPTSLADAAQTTATLRTAAVS